MDQVNQVYACSRQLSLTSHMISFPALGEFSHALKRFKTLLGESLEEPYWASFIRPLKRYLFDLSAAPWPARGLQEYTRLCQRNAAGQVERFHLMNPSLVEPARALVSALDAIALCDHDPVLEELQVIANGVKDSQIAAIIITESRLVSTAREAIATAPDYAQWPVLVPRNVRRLDTYDCFSVIGSPSWYRRAKYIFSAPRASAIHILCYDWMSIQWQPESALAAPVKGSSEARQIRIEYSPAIPGVTDEDVIPLIADIDSVLKRAERESGNDSDHQPVEARLLVLESDKGVFIESEGDATVLVIDLNQGVDQRVRRIVHRNVEPGLYILLRTESGGNYIVPVADQILGNRAEELRERQQTWKARLRLAVRERGIDEVVKVLRDHGSTVASYQNLRNWMQERTIATNDRQDFFAIMELAGLSDEAQSYWDTMLAIRRAHQKAGSKIRRQLVEQVNKGDLAELERIGLMEFTLDEKTGGSLTAYRIKSMAERTVEVLPHLIDTPFPLEDL
jgi:hypothetical protein